MAASTVGGMRLDVPRTAGNARFAGHDLLRGQRDPGRFLRGQGQGFVARIGVRRWRPCEAAGVRKLTRLARLAAHEREILRARRKEPMPNHSISRVQNPAIARRTRLAVPSSPVVFKKSR